MFLSFFFFYYCHCTSVTYASDLDLESTNAAMMEGFDRVENLN